MIMAEIEVCVTAVQAETLRALLGEALQDEIADLLDCALEDIPGHKLSEDEARLQRFGDAVREFIALEVVGLYRVFAPPPPSEALEAGEDELEAGEEAGG